MSSHSHDDHQSNEAKPVAFTIPLILGLVTVFIIFLFLKVCDPKPHSASGHEEHAKTETAHHEAAPAAEPVKAESPAATPDSAKATPVEEHQH